MKIKELIKILQSLPEDAFVRKSTFGIIIFFNKAQDSITINLN